MPTSYTNKLGFALPVTGELSGTWGDIENAQITQLVEDAIAGFSSQDVTNADWTLSITGSGLPNQARSVVLVATGSPIVGRNIIAPALSKVYVVANMTAQTLTIKTATSLGAAISSQNYAIVAFINTDFVIVGTPPGAASDAIIYAVALG